VVLTPHEFLYAAMVGCTREIDNRRKQRFDRYGPRTTSPWDLHIEGAAGELALAKYLGHYWSGALGNLDAADVRDWQVRTSAGEDSCLIVHPADGDDDRFVLIIGTAPNFLIRGWAYGRDAKRLEFWRDPSGRDRPAYFLPQSQLRPMEQTHAGFSSRGASRSADAPQRNRRKTA
jgi:hypothetical protein